MGSEMCIRDRTGVNFNDFAGNQFITVTIPASTGGTQTGDSLTVFRGVALGGTLADSFASDDDRLSYNPGFVLNDTEAPVWLIFDATLPATPTSLEIVTEAQAGTPGITATLEAFNWTTSTYDIVDTSPTSFNNDTVVTADLTGGISDYVNGSNEVRSRIGWRQTGFIINFPWVASLDQLVWNFQ